MNNLEKLIEQAETGTTLFRNLLEQYKALPEVTAEDIPQVKKLMIRLQECSDLIAGALFGMEG